MKHIVTAALLAGALAAPAVAADYTIIAPVSYTHLTLPTN